MKKEKAVMGHILRMNPVFKEMIWGGTKLKDIYGYRSRVITQESAGQFLHIRMEIVQSRMENTKEKLYLGCLKITENYLEISKEINFHYL